MLKWAEGTTQAGIIPILHYGAITPPLVLARLRPESNTSGFQNIGHGA